MLRHQPGVQQMPFEAVVVSAAVTAAFVIFIAVLWWAWSRAH